MNSYQTLSPRSSDQMTIPKDQNNQIKQNENESKKPKTPKTEEQDNVMKYEIVKGVLVKCHDIFKYYLIGKKGEEYSVRI